MSSGEVDERPTRVPRRVWRGCEGESVQERSEYGLPRISNVASKDSVCYQVKGVAFSVPGVDTEVDFPTTSIVLLSVEGVDWREMYLYPPTRRPARKCAGNA
jgi:hypothetical protein